MTFMQADTGEFEAVCQHHDAFVEQGRLELMAEALQSQDNAAQLGSTERPMLDLGLALNA